jgi:hypothetical protein
LEDAVGVENEVHRGEGEDEDLPAGIVYLKNKAGQDLFLTEGSAWFSLGAGETTHVRLHFDVAANPRSEVLEVELNIGDEEFYEYFTDKIQLPVHFTVADAPPVDEIPAHHKSYRTRGPVPVLSGALPETQRVATADGSFTATGKLGDMVRLDLPWETGGWVAADDLKAAPGAGDELTIEPWDARSPPVVVLTTRVGGTAVDTDTIELRGVVRDERQVQDMFVFVNGTKVYYHRMDAAAEGSRNTLEFSVPIELDDGVNYIEIMARDDEDLVGSMSIGVYRQQSLETAQGPSAQDAG